MRQRPTTGSSRFEPHPRRLPKRLDVRGLYQNAYQTTSSVSSGAIGLRWCHRGRPSANSNQEISTRRRHWLASRQADVRRHYCNLALVAVRPTVSPQAGDWMATRRKRRSSRSAYLLRGQSRRDWEHNAPRRSLALFGDVQKLRGTRYPQSVSPFIGRCRSLRGTLDRDHVAAERWARRPVRRAA
jgi:hypothetical protein